MVKAKDLRKMRIEIRHHAVKVEIYAPHHHPPITEGDAGGVFCVVMSVSDDANGAGMAVDAFYMPPLLKRDDDAVNACG